MKITNCKEKPLLLFSCLDWGLGHATRSIPLILEFLANGCNLILACNSIQKKIFESELPGVMFADIPGYGIKYSINRWRTRLEILFQLRKILTRINSEKHWLSKFLKHNKVTAIISDNRYGLSHDGIPSILITHQLSPHTGYGPVADKISRKFLYKYINRFSECWIPDSRNSPVAGSLSHPGRLPRTTVKYIGTLSRFEECHCVKEEETIDLLIVLSGPEPQRTIFENILLEQLISTQFKTALVRGLPDDTMQVSINNSLVSVYNHLDSKTLNRIACSANFVLCRSGYTSIMDMLKLKKKLILIPTPGQPEQEYLGRWLSQNHLAVSFDQKHFSIDRAMKGATNYSFKEAIIDMNEYKFVVKDFVERISS